MDPKATGIISLDDAKWGLFHFGYKLSKEEAQMMTNLCDKDKSGNVNYFELLKFLRVYFYIE